MSPGERPTEPLASVSLEVGPFPQRVSTLVALGTQLIVAGLLVVTCVRVVFAGPEVRAVTCTRAGAFVTCEQTSATGPRTFRGPREGLSGGRARNGPPFLLIGDAIIPGVDGEDAARVQSLSDGASVTFEASTDRFGVVNVVGLLMAALLLALAGFNVGSIRRQRKRTRLSISPQVIVVDGTTLPRAPGDTLDIVMWSRSRGEAGGTWALIYGPSRTPLVLRSAMKGDELQPTLETVRRALSEVPPPPAT